MDIELCKECEYFLQHYVRARVGYTYRTTSCGHCTQRIRGRYLPCKSDCAHFKKRETLDEKTLVDRAENIEFTLDYLLPQIDILLELLKKTSS